MLQAENIPPFIIEELLDAVPDNSPLRVKPGTFEASLTDADADCLMFAAQGLNSIEIGGVLSLKPRTIRNRQIRLHRIFGVESTIATVIAADHHGIERFPDIEQDEQLHLQPNEHYALQGCAFGLASKQIARMLHLTPKTIDNCIYRAREALVAENRIAATRKAIGMKIVHRFADVFEANS